MQRCGIVPPPVGMLDVATVDAACTMAGMSIGERFTIKGPLIRCGLLPNGRAI